MALTAAIDPGVRFRDPIVVAVRPARGADGRLLLIEQAGPGLRGAVWDPERGRTAVPGSIEWGATPTPDGRAVIQLLDPTGSEVGHLHLVPIDGTPPRDLTPDLGWTVVRGVDVQPDGRAAVATLVDADGFTLWLLDLAGGAPPSPLFRSSNEAWYGILSEDGTLAAIDTTDHDPGIRRFAVTVIEVATGAVVATLSDGPLGPVHRIRFASRSGDPRLLVETERSGFARPCIWDPLTGERIDLDLPDLAGDVLALDWDAERDRVLLAHVDAGVHRLLEATLGATTVPVPVEAPPGAVLEPDVGDVHPRVFASHYAPDGALRLVRSRWHEPIEVLERRAPGMPWRTLVPPSPVPPGLPFRSLTIVSRDGTPVQLWLGRPEPSRVARGTILAFHGGPNLAVVDRYDPSAQAWIDAGFAYAALNFRGSVTFGRAFREGFWGQLGDRELEDVEAALDRLRAEGLGDPATTFATGVSYGGLLTLLCLGRLPAAFAGGLAHVALADWTRAYAAMNPALQAAWRGFLGGTPETAPERFRRASPIAYVADVRAPVWLNQGLHDTRTPPGQAQAYADALRAAGGDVCIEWFDAGHGLPGLERTAIEQARMLQLVERRLGGQRWDEPADR